MSEFFLSSTWETMYISASANSSTNEMKSLPPKKEEQQNKAKLLYGGKGINLVTNSPCDCFLALILKQSF